MRRMCLLAHFWKVLVSIGRIILHIFHYCHCPSCNDSRFPAILTQSIFFSLESCSLEIRASQRDQGSGSLFCSVLPYKPHAPRAFTDTSVRVIFVSCCTGLLPSHTKTSSCPSGPCLCSDCCQMHQAVSLPSDFCAFGCRIPSRFWFPIPPAAPHRCSHRSVSEDVSVCCVIWRGYRDALAGETAVSGTGTPPERAIACGVCC